MIRAAALALVLAAGAAGAAPRWLPVPGAPDIAIDAGSVDVQGSLVTVSVGGPPSLLRPLRDASDRNGATWHRAVLRTQFDCGHRQLRVLGLVGYGTAGQVMQASTTAGSARPVPADAAGEALYDASCELARALEPRPSPAALRAQAAAPRP